MTNLWNKFLLLMWKNWVQQIRKKKILVIKIAAPIICIGMLVLIRTLNAAEAFEGTKFTAFDPLVRNNDEINAWHDAELFHLESIVYSPCLNTKVEDIMNLVQHPTLKVEPCYSNAKALESHLMNARYRDQILAGIQFDDALINNGNQLPKDINIKFRFYSELRIQSFYGWRTKNLYNTDPTSGPGGFNKNEGFMPYYDEGFLSLQKAVGQAVIKVVQSDPGPVEDFPNILMQRYPYSDWVDDPFLKDMAFLGVLFFLLSFVFTCIRSVQVITIEKEEQLKESIKIMGLSNWLHWVAWFVKTFGVLLISIILVTIIVKIICVRLPDLAIFTHSDGGVIFIFLMLYVFAATTFCFAVSVFFDKATMAALAAALLWFVAYIPYPIITEGANEKGLSTLLPVSLLFNSAMCFGIQLISIWETIEEGAQFSNIWNTVTPEDSLMLGHIMMMMIVDGILYLLLALYVEAVFPGEFGVPKPWYFPITKSYWCGNNVVELDLSTTQSINLNEDIFEPEPKNLPIGIQIKGLGKVFSNKKVAVHDINLNMYEGQITALLGHNGAGKTTTMSILTGMFPPSSGTAYIDGYDIRTQIEAARSSLGLCPQHNILFDTLTVKEHLTFFAKLKGLTGSAVEDEVDKYISLLELEPKRQVRITALSGGMKRKLSIGIALCGNSKVVMLDEPTAGIDPAARHAIWDILQKEKHGRTILLSTHFMDEADLLGDRIAIMANGQLQCCGSSFFLKKHYSTGYHLIIEKTPDCNVGVVTSLCRNYIPDIKVGSNIGSELSYLLREDQSHLFENMLRNLESNSNSLGIRSYGISSATLEEVFMKVGSGQGHEEIRNATERNKNNNFVSREVESDSSSSPRLPLVSGGHLLMNQTLAMFMKKALTHLRTWHIYVLQLVIAIFFIIIGLVIARNIPSYFDTPVMMEMTFDRYEDPVAVINTDNVNDPYYASALAIINSKNCQLDDLKTDNISDYILKKTKDVPIIVRNCYLVGASIDTSGDSIIAWFNNIPFHTPSLGLDFAINTILKKFSPDHTIISSNHPIPYSIETKLLNAGLGFITVVLNIVYGMAILSPFYIMFCIREHVVKSKHLQYVSGVGVFIFWLTAYLWDLVTYLLIVVVIFIILVIFQQEGFSTAAELGRIFSILLLFGMVMLPLGYLYAYIFNQPSMGVIIMIIVNILTGAVPFILYQIFGGNRLKDAQRIVDRIFIFVPIYNMGASIRDMCTMLFGYKNCKLYVDNCMKTYNLTEERCLKLIVRNNITICDNSSQDYYSLTEEFGVGKNVLIFVIGAVVFMVILIVCEYDYIFCSCMQYCRFRGERVSDEIDSDSSYDTDVLAERLKVQNIESDQIEEYGIVLQNATKCFKKFVAVDHLCLTVSWFECFGLLGVNGAGKTSTFKLLTGDMRLSSGQVWIVGYNINQRKNVYKHIGFCPQFDALLDDLTGRETLIMYGLLRGVHQNEIKYVAEKLSEDLDFHQHLDKKVKQFSGGNKRKLSTAIALIGNPPIIFLDEPSTGMDPATKRNLWNTLCRVRDSGKCLVLTSHSMEECEALCTRIVIMVNGQFKCLGSPQHLKNKFSEGVRLTIQIQKAKFNQESSSNIEQFVLKHFPSAVLKEKYGELLTYYIANKQQSWSTLFGIMERGKKGLNIESYSLGQTTLEQVFLSIAKLPDGQAET